MKKRKLTQREKVDQEIREKQERWSDLVRQAGVAVNREVKRKLLFEAWELKDEINECYRRRRRLDRDHLPSSQPRLF